MSKLGQTRHTWQLRTTVDPRRPFDAQLLLTLDEIQQKECISESRAVMRLLWLGWHAYAKPNASEVSGYQLELVSGPGQQRPRRLRAAKPEASPAPPATTEKTVLQVAEATRAVEQSPASHIGSVARASLAAEAMLVPATATITGELPGLAGGLMKFRTMALSRSVAPPEAAAPRSSTNAIEAHTLLPAVLASTLAKLKSDGREF